MRPPKKPAPVRRAEAGSGELLWPPPVLDAEILWLEARRSQPPALPGHAEPVRQGASRHEIAAGEDGDRQPVRHAPWPPLAPAAVKLAAILTAGVPFDWHDAIAIVQALACDAAPDVTTPPAGAIPDLKSIGLEPNGRVHAVIDRSSPEPIVCGLGRVLQTLLQHSPAPAHLCAFVQQMSHPDARASLRHWTSQLARWERPDRRGTLVALYERARNPQPGGRANMAPAFRSAPMSPRQPAADASPLDAPDTLAPRRERNPIAITALAAIGCMMLGSIVTVLFMGESWTPPPPPKPAHDIELPVERLDVPLANPSRSTGTAGRKAPEPRLLDGRLKVAPSAR